MNDLDRQVERQIVRRLDGELPVDQEAALDRRLLKDLDAHAAADAYRRADVSAREAIRWVVDRPLRLARIEQPAETARSRVALWKAAAVAALVLIAAGAWAVAGFWPEGLRESAQPMAGELAKPVTAGADIADVVPAKVSDVPNFATDGQRRTERRVLGVVNSENEILLLEWKHQQTKVETIACDL